ncbi:MAG: hypothetical protein KatS3mg081_1403 [Gemmatimonadales bacterium]|nr:MAG: hypothetical protein KatS3mg081_1403 [Gemmatimonadales bacterium]
MASLRGIVLLLCGAGIVACEEQPVVIYRQCRAEALEEWWSRYISSRIDQPPCPVGIDFPGQLVAFEGVFTAALHIVLPDAGYNALGVRVLNDANPPYVVGNATADWRPYDPRTARSRPFLHYQAGTTLAYRSPSYDVAQLQTYLYPYGSSGGVFPAGAEAQIRAVLTFPTSISGATTAPAYSWVTVTATVSGSYTPPLTYSWAVDGSPACGNSDSCTWQLGAAGSYTTFTVEVTDAQGAVGSASLTVAAEYADCQTCMKPRGGDVLRRPLAEPAGPAPKPARAPFGAAADRAQTRRGYPRFPARCARLASSKEKSAC